ncbi:MAG TPA: HAD family hydrolase [Bacteroidota bacterium]|nr:HAD family hydrolase [Bacteroidota bacterium]
MKKLQAVLFDLDDTLYPESEFVFSGFRSVARWAQETLGYSYEASELRLRELFTNGVRRNTFNVWLKEAGNQDVKNIERAITIYRNHVPEIQPYPEVPLLLKRLQQTYTLGIISDGVWQVQERKLAALGISSFFTTVIFTDKFGSEFWKPSPEPFKMALDQLKVHSSAACYIGDNILKDFKGARIAGLTTIWFRNREGVYSDSALPSKEHRPEYELHSFAALEGLLITL